MIAALLLVGPSGCSSTGGMSRSSPDAERAPQPSTSSSAAPAPPVEDPAAEERAGRFVEARSAFEAACASGDGRACVRRATYDWLGLGAPKDRKRAVDRYAQACADDNWIACSYEALVCARDRLHVCSSKGRLSALDDAALGKIEDACVAGDADACLAAGLHPKSPPGTQPDLELLGRACDGGVLDGCLVALMVEWEQGQKDSAAMANGLRRLCEAGNAEACAAGATATNPAAIRGRKRNEEVEALLDKACNTREPTAWFLGSLGAPDAPLVAGSCETLSILLSGTESDRAQQLTKRACLLGLDLACAK